jgi:hypothetical protein
VLFSSLLCLMHAPLVPSCLIWSLSYFMKVTNYKLIMQFSSPSITSAFLGPNIFSALFSVTLRCLYYFGRRGNICHLHKKLQVK